MTIVTYPDEEAFTVAWKDMTLTRRRLCEMFGCSDFKLRVIAEHFGMSPKRKNTAYCGGRKKPKDPSPEEIRAMCAEFRRSWPERRFKSDHESIPKVYRIKRTRHGSLQITDNQ